MKEFIRLCAKCGKEYKGIGDTRYCPECTAEERKNVMRVRICKDCGKEFFGGPKSKRCPDCARKARYESEKRCRQNKNKKPAGSEGVCAICGATFIRNSPRQKYCGQKCARIGLLEYQRERKKTVRKEPDNEIQKNVRSQRRKVCAYCGTAFWVQTASITCSEYCQKKQRALTGCQNKLKKMQIKLDDLQVERDAYRKSVQINQSKTQDKII
mgnify:CR=1 FL=1